MINDNDKQLLVEQLKKTPIIQVVCEKFNISRATFYRWRKDDSNFKKLTDKALKSGKTYINDLAESQLISLIKEKNTTAIIYWLKYNHPNYSDQPQPLNQKQRQLIIHAIGDTSETKNAYKTLISGVVEGKINRWLFNSLSSIINRISKSNPVDNDSAKMDVLYKLLQGKPR